MTYEFRLLSPVYKLEGDEPAVRKIYTIYINPDVWKAAREKGRNNSRICENTLILAVQKGGNLGTLGSGWPGK